MTNIFKNVPIFPPFNLILLVRLPEFNQHGNLKIQPYYLNDAGGKTHQLSWSIDDIDQRLEAIKMEDWNAVTIKAFSQCDQMVCSNWATCKYENLPINIKICQSMSKFCQILNKRSFFPKTFQFSLFLVTHCFVPFNIGLIVASLC